MKKIFYFFFSGLIPLSILFLCLFLFDPFQLYHKPYMRGYIFDPNMRYQAAGIINNYDFDSIIMGSSIAVNTSSYEATKKIGGKWVNLAYVGASSQNRQERKKILQYATKKKDIHQIIYVLHPDLLTNDKTNKDIFNLAFLYDNNPINDIKIYLDENYIMCLLGLHKICLRGSETLDRPAAWINRDYVQKKLGGIQSWLKNTDDLIIYTALKDIVEYKRDNKKTCAYNKKGVYENIDNEIGEIIKENKNTTFYLVLAPFSRLYYKINSCQNTINQVKESLIYILKKYGNKNVRIYGFDNTFFPDNIENYIDFIHYDEKVNSFMLDAIKNDTHRITLENVDSYFEEMRKKIEAYDIKPLRKQIIESGVLSH